MPSTPPPQPHHLLRPPNSLPPSLLERYFAQHEFSTPLLACCSDVEPLTVRALLEISGKEETTGEETIFEGGRLSLGYLDPRGSLRLREAVAREHGGGDGGDGSEGGVTADDVLVAAPQELAYLLQRVLLQGKEKDCFSFFLGGPRNKKKRKEKEKKKLSPKISSLSLSLSCR